MKLTFTRQALTAIAITLATVISFFPVGATTFDQQEVEQELFIAIARPYGNHKFDLLILQQIPGKQQCWRENGSNPIIIEPLLLNFDFSGSCERSTDSNGYSLRVDGQDFGLDYLLRVIERDGELVLVGTHRTNTKQNEIIVGRTHGLSQNFLKINLDPGWRFTKRSYGGQLLGHIYLTGDSSAMTSPQPRTTAATPTPAPSNTENSVRELIFTANDSPSPVASPASPTSPVPNRLPPPPSPRQSTSELPSFSELPPLDSPVPTQNNAVVPPPPPSAEGNYRKSLSEAVDSLSGSNAIDTVSTPSASRSYRVMVSTKTGSQQTQVRSLYPDAFPTSYNGRSLWQIGRFSSRENAQQAQQSLESRGLSAIIVP